MMFPSSSSSSSKAIYMAVPLLPQSTNDNKDKDISKKTQRQTLLSSSSSLSVASRFACFMTGGAMGLFCYATFYVTILPLIPHLANSLYDNALSSLIWSLLTTLFAYSIGHVFLLALHHRCYCHNNNNKSRRPQEEENKECNNDQVQDDHDNKETNVEKIKKDKKKNTDWDDMEYFYALGVFLGFSSACTIYLVMTGVPTIFLMTFLILIVFWTCVMAWLGGDNNCNNNNNNSRSRTTATTVLPTLVL